MRIKRLTRQGPARIIIDYKRIIVDPTFLFDVSIWVTTDFKNIDMKNYIIDI